MSAGGWRITLLEPSRRVGTKLAGRPWRSGLCQFRVGRGIRIRLSPLRWIASLGGLVSRADKRDARRLDVDLDVDHANAWILRSSASWPPCLLFSCSLQANHGYLWRPRLLLQEVGGYDHETQSSS